MSESSSVVVVDDVVAVTRDSAVDVGNHGIKLRRHNKRIVVFGLLGAVVVVLVGIAIQHGVTVVPHVEDSVGSTANADWYVSAYQTVNGFLSSVIEMVTEAYFEPLWAVIVTYLANVAWLRRQRSRNVTTQGANKDDDQPGRAIKLLLVWMTPIMMYLINVSFTSMYVEHQVVNVHQALAPNDLMDYGVSSDVSVVANKTERSILNNSVLYAAFSQRIRPFLVTTSTACERNLLQLIKQATNVEDPNSTETKTMSLLLNEWAMSIDLGAASVTYGFQTNDWNTQVLGNLVQSQTTITISDTDATTADTTAKLNEFNAASSFDMATAYELVAQGQILLERSIANAPVVRGTNLFRCDEQGPNETSDHFCRGVPSALPLLTNYDRPTNQTFANLNNDIKMLLRKAFQSNSSPSLSIRFDRLNLSTDVAMTAMTLDAVFPDAL